ncbi:MAG TPA: CoA transferase, partial [Thermoleophilaceae bacterium]|nr:CoA transferase [Thermoleophilaceae bacterium]
AAIAERLMGATAAEWGHTLQAAGVPAGQVNNIAGALELAAQLGLAPTVTLPGPGGADVTLPANPVGMSATPPRYDAGPPALGAMSAEEALALVRGRSG